MIDHRWLPFSSRWEVDGSGSRRMPAPGAASSSSPFASQARTRGRQIQESVEPIRLFTIREIQKATNNFDQSLLIRRNGYTELYRGTISGFTQPVAIKVPDFKSRGKRSVNVMINDIAIRSRISHRNVANLIGVCLEDERLCSVYEFFPNGTLDSNLFNEQMPWETRLKVAAEIAAALAYMHSSLSNPIIHRDVKPEVIHLDSDYTSKIFDLDLAKSLPDGLDHVSTCVCGTMGYLDPEYMMTGHLTCKADVYSFGVLLVQFLTRKRAFDEHRPPLVPFFLSSLAENTFDTEVVNADTLDQMKNVADLARKCLELRSEMRPSMARVALALEQLMVDNSFPSRGNIHHSQSNNTGTPSTLGGSFG